MDNDKKEVVINEKLRTLLRTSVHGYGITTEDTIRYQDIFGHSTISELASEANGEYREIFFSLYAQAYGVVEAIKFYSKNSDYINGLVLENEELKKKVDELGRNQNTLKQQLASETAQVFDMKRELGNLQVKRHDDIIQIEKLEDTIIKLKAKLYDYMEGKA